MNTLANIEIARTFYSDILYIFVGNCNTQADMLKDLLKNAGLLVILAGVIILALVVFAGSQTNAYLALSLALVIIGLLGHILINKLVN